MMLGVVGSDGARMPPYWFPKGLRVGSKEYLEVLQTVVKPWLDATYPEGNYVWQQDGAPGHNANVTQKWLKANLANFWPKELWPPSSPDLNPLDYGFWGVLESRACSVPHKSVEALKISVGEHWANMSEAFVQSTCLSFRRRLEAIIAANGGHIEN